MRVTTRAMAEWTAAAGATGALLATAHTAYNLRVLRTPSLTPPEVVERVSVLVPARDEAGRIGPCISALLASRGVRDLEILVLDDGSADGTADVVRRTAAGDPRVTLIDGGASPPPVGWTGKTWACARLAAQATGSVLVFVDADVLVAGHGLAASEMLLRMTGLELVSPYPRQEADGALPRLVQPLLQWSWLTTLPLRLAEHSPRESLVAANGQLLVVDAAAYRSAGGHDAVRGEVLDDVALLRAFKRSGARGVVADGTEVATCRMYDDGPALVEGYTKSLWSAFGSPASSAAVVAVIPLVQRRWRALVSMAAALGVLALLATARVPGILGDWASRLGDGLVVVRPIDLHRNESWYGLLEALGVTHFRFVWLAVAVLLLATGVATAVVRTRRHDVIGALAALTLAGVLASTVSWTHHWIWIPVLLVTVQWRGPRATSQTAHLAAVGALAAAMLLWVPAWFALPDHSLSSTGLTWIASYSYVLFGTFALATLAWTTVERAPHTTRA